MRSLENGTRSITPERARQIEVATDGEVTRAALLPLIFGPPPPPTDDGRAAA